MTIKIDGLYEVNDFEKMIAVLLDAFSDYPKLKIAFENPDERMMALEAVLRFYCAYDLCYGKAFSLGKEMNEVAVVVESREMGYTFFRHLRAGSYSKAYLKSMGKLIYGDQRKLKKIFSEVDRLEKTVHLPRRDYLYVDFVGVKTSMQGQRRGRTLMMSICDYAAQQHLPTMLFTNTEADIRFYRNLGFEKVGVTHSEKYGFTNTYMVKLPT